MLSRGENCEQSARRHAVPRLRVIADDAIAPEALPEWAASLLRRMENLEALAAELDRKAESADTEKSKTALGAAAADSRRLISTIRHILSGVGRVRRRAAPRDRFR
jgi:hypothetical protein